MTGPGPPLEELTVRVPGRLCRRCVRALSRRISDLSGVVSLRVDARQGLVHVRGPVDRDDVAAALRAGGFAGPEAGAG